LGVNSIDHDEVISRSPGAAAKSSHLSEVITQLAVASGVTSEEVVGGLHSEVSNSVNTDVHLEVILGGESVAHHAGAGGVAPEVVVGKDSTSDASSNLLLNDSSGLLFASHSCVGIDNIGFGGSGNGGAFFDGTVDGRAISDDDISIGSNMAIGTVGEDHGATRQRVLHHAVSRSITGETVISERSEGDLTSGDLGFN
jgi:hypothetical protein